MSTVKPNLDKAGDIIGVIDGIACQANILALAVRADEPSTGISEVGMVL